MTERGTPMVGTSLLAFAMYGLLFQRENIQSSVTEIELLYEFLPDGVCLTYVPA